MFCIKCGHALADNAAFCARCGTPVFGEVSQSGIPSAAATHPVPNHPSVSATTTDAMAEREELWAAVIGPKNTNKYLSTFLEFESSGSIRPTWHWPAFFVTWFWLAYRKMWGLWWWYIIAPTLFGGLIGFVIGLIGGLMGMSESSIESLVLLVVLPLFLVLPGMYAKALLYRKYQKLIARAEGLFPTHRARVAFLASRGGTGGGVWIVAIVLGVFFVLGILAAIALPAYQDYVNRAKAQQSLLSGMNIASHIATTYNETGRFNPNDHPPIDSPDHQVDVQPNGEVLITLKFFSSPNTGKQLVLEPVVSQGKIIRWDCARVDMPEKFVPAPCRRLAATR